MELVLTALGVSALIAASPRAFAALKIAGGLYLVWLGVQAWRTASGIPSSSPRRASAASARTAACFMSSLIFRARTSSARINARQSVAV